ncbi:MAG: SPOR domain-containing protein [Spirochaetales bacterium]|nr:SPOR domain-containing protein [Spirochaetales bacterium]
MISFTKRHRILFFSILLIISGAILSLYAESTWEGSAAMGRYGEFPFTGNYAASNSFSQNAYVEVENLENGKRTRVIVVGRQSDPSLLMLLSNEASEELGILKDDVVRVKVKLLASDTAERKLLFDDLAYNPDQDLNPAASALTSQELIDPEGLLGEYDGDVEGDCVDEPDCDVAEAEPEPAPELVTSGLEDGEPDYKSDSNSDMEALPEMIKPQSSEEVAVSEPIPEPDPVSLQNQLAAAVPDEAAISDDYSETPDVEPKANVLEAEDSIDTEPEETEDVLVADAMPVLPEPEKEEVPVSEPLVEEAPNPDYGKDVEIKLVPAEERPPKVETVEVPSPEPVKKEEPAKSQPELPEGVVLITDLQHQKKYLQLGSFSEEKLAIKAASKVDTSYPVMVLTDKNPAGGTYKVLLGPLKDDERGILLYTFRGDGYPDAFIKTTE